MQTYEENQAPNDDILLNWNVSMVPLHDVRMIAQKLQEVYERWHVTRTASHV